MKLNYNDISKQISDKSSREYKVKDVNRILKLLEETLKENLEQGNEIKLGSIAKFKAIDQDEKKCYDGINKRYYTIPPKKRVTVKPLKGISDIN